MPSPRHKKLRLPSRRTMLRQVAQLLLPVVTRPASPDECADWFRITESARHLLQEELDAFPAVPEWSHWAWAARQAGYRVRGARIFGLRNVLG